MKISVFTPSIRTEGLRIVQECLRNQTFNDFEWLVEIGYGRHDLNAAYNRMLRRAKGEIFVSYQDFIKVENDFLERIIQIYEQNQRTFYTCPVGKTNDKEYKSNDIRWDFREKSTKAIWNEWEIDLGFAPMDGLRKVGGFDEELDKYWSFDNVSVGFRAHCLGYDFGVVNDLKGVAFDHDAHEEHPFRKDFNPPFFNERLEEYKFAPKLDYLDYGVIEYKHNL